MSEKTKFGPRFTIGSYSDYWNIAKTAEACEMTEQELIDYLARAANESPATPADSSTSSRTRL